MAANGLYAGWEPSPATPPSVGMGSLGGFEETPRPPIAAGTGWLRHGNPPGDLRLAPRCGARTRAGGCCRQPAMKNGRCRLHGGRSTGPRTAAGRAACAAARTRHGLRGKAFIALRREGRRRARRMAALRDEGLARQAIENGVAPPVAWFRRVAAGRTFAELVAAEVRESKRPRRKGEDPRNGYLPRGARPIVDDLATIAAFARRLAADMRRLKARAARRRGPLPGAVPIRTVTVVRRTLRAAPDDTLVVVSETVSTRCYPARPGSVPTVVGAGFKLAPTATTSAGPSLGMGSLGGFANTPSAARRGRRVAAPFRGTPRRREPENTGFVTPNSWPAVPNSCKDLRIQAS
jgi:hypothetical protein